MRRFRAGSIVVGLFSLVELTGCDAPDELPSKLPPGTDSAGKADGVPADCSAFSFDLSPPDASPEFSLSELLPGDAPGPTIWTPSAAFDVVRDRLVAFDPGSGTWEWNAFDGWVLRAGLDEGPRTDARAQGVRMAYDRSRATTVLFGGLDSTIWEWDGTSWSSRDVTGPAPLARNDSALVYDRDRELVWMFGGESLDGARLRDLWSWDGATWEQHSPDGPLPAARRGHVMAYDANRGRLVLHGGIQNESLTWEWDGDQWSSIVGVTSRAAFGALVFDEEQGQVLGIRARVSRTNAEDTPWAWDGGQWVRVSAGEMPKRQIRSGVVYDPLRGRTLLIQPRYTLGSLAQLVRGSATNRSPSISVSTPAPRRLWPGDPLEVQLTGQDPDGHAVALDSGVLPEGADFDRATGVLRWTPTAEQAGEHVLTVGASDGDLCSQIRFEVEVVDPEYPDLPVGGYALYQHSVSIPADYIERYFQFEGYHARVHEVPDSGALCSLFGENPGKLTIVCRVRAPNDWKGPPYRAAEFRGQSPVEPDGSFNLAMTWGAGPLPSPHPSHFPGVGDVGTPTSPACSLLRGHLRWVGDSRIHVEIDRLDTSCPRSLRESGALSNAGSTAQAEFRGYAFDPSVPQPTNVGAGVGLATATFWHAEQERFITVEGPFWLEWAGGLYTLEGLLVATSGSDVPTLIPSILDIFRDDNGVLVVAQ